MGLNGTQWAYYVLGHALSRRFNMPAKLKERAYKSKNGTQNERKKERIPTL
jgi:hypothetical protein